MNVKLWFELVVLVLAVFSCFQVQMRLAADTLAITLPLSVNEFVFSMFYHQHFRQ